MFELDKVELQNFIEWDSKHECSLKEYAGAIGGRISYKFTPTNLGVVVKVICGCGEEADITNYDW